LLRAEIARSKRFQNHVLFISLGVYERVIHNTFACTCNLCRYGSVKRIGDVRYLRDAQFAEDASPMAHPVGGYGPKPSC
jgi:hypothetical protein